MPKFMQSLVVVVLLSLLELQTEICLDMVFSPVRLARLCEMPPFRAREVAVNLGGLFAVVRPDAAAAAL